MTCGTVKINSILSVDWSADLHSIQGEIFVILTSDLKDKILIEAETDENGNKIIIFEIKGQGWSSCQA